MKEKWIGLVVLVLLLGSCSAHPAPAQTLPTTLPTLTAIPSLPSVTATATASATPFPENIATATPMPTRHYIPGTTRHRQYFAIGCETAAAMDWATYFGKNLNEFNLQYELPLSDNPDYGFVGNVTDPWGQVPPYSYGVYAAPVAEVLRKHDLPAVGVKHFTLEQLKGEIAADRPVMVWVIGNVIGGIPYEFTDKEGRKVVVAAYEHVVIVTGYSADSIRYMNEGRFYETPSDVFLNSWGVLENRAVHWGSG